MPQLQPGSDAKERTAEPTQKLALILIGIAAIGLAAAMPVLYGWYVGWAIETDASAWNNFGTFVGGVVGPILSSLAFFGLLYTVHLQQKQLVLTRSALSLNRPGICGGSNL